MRKQGGQPAAVERLRRRGDFRAAQSGARAPGRNFVVQALARGDQRGVRVGFTVSRQVGNAVERNRVRRRLREIVRLSAAADAARLQPGFDYVLIGRRAALAASFGEMMHEFDAALSRLHAGGDRTGTGSPRRGPLHEAGSSPRSQSRRSKLPKSPELPPHER